MKSALRAGVISFRKLIVNKVKFRVRYVYRVEVLELGANYPFKWHFSIDINSPARAPLSRIVTVLITIYLLAYYTVIWNVF